MLLRLILPATLILCWGGPAKAWDLNDDLRLFGHAQFWVTAWEQMESAEGLRQDPSGDEAAISTSGFSLSRARLGLNVDLYDDLFQLMAQVRLERNPALLDLFAGVRAGPWLRLRIGQFKIPGPAETLASSRNLDFIFRPLITEFLVDYSLSRTSFRSSLFYGVHTYLRDMGLAADGELDLGVGRGRYMIMLGNGLGANTGISGDMRKDTMLTNEGQFFSALRLELADFFDIVTIGAHLNYNYHDNMAYNSARVVVDLKRIAYSVDGTVVIPGTGLRLGGLWGQGEIRDDFDNDGRVDLMYDGWEARLLWRIDQVLDRLAVAGNWQDHTLEIGLRYDMFSSEWNQNGSRESERRWTFGINYGFKDFMRLQLNYVMRDKRDPSLPTLDDNILLLNIQAAL